MSKYTTIVKTKFSNFLYKDECEKDQEQMRSRSKKLSEIGIVHIDNPQ